MSIVCPLLLARSPGRSLYEEEMKASECWGPACGWFVDEAVSDSRCAIAVLAKALGKNFRPKLFLKYPKY